jgi:hypothetical protein
MKHQKRFSTIFTVGLAFFLFCNLARAQSATIIGTWSDSNSTEDGYRIYRDDTPHTKMCETAADAITCQFADNISVGECYLLVAFSATYGDGPSVRACGANLQSPGTFTIIIK